MSADWYPGIRAFCAHWKHAPMLQQTFEALDREFVGENDACIDAAKGFVECACRLLIQELDNPLSPIKDWPDSPIQNTNPIFNNWVTAVVRLLSIVDRRDDPFNRVISRHYDLTEALGKFRDIAGSISHGKEGLSKKLSAHHRRAAMLAADAIVTFLHETYLEREPDPVRTFEPYERFEASNALIDSYVSIRCKDDDDGLLHVILVLPGDEKQALTIEPSRLLFGVDRDAYKSVLDACREANITKAQSEDVT